MRDIPRDELHEIHVAARAYDYLPSRSGGRLNKADREKWHLKVLADRDEYFRKNPNAAHLKA